MKLLKMIMAESYPMVVIWWGLWCSFVLPAAAGSGHSKLFESGTVFTYGYESSVLINQMEAGIGNAIDFQVKGLLTLETVWKNRLERLILLKLLEPKLLVKSKTEQSTNGFGYVPYSSKFDKFENTPFLVHLNKGNIKGVYINQNEDTSTVNLKKGIASFFQFQLDNQEVSEIDSSGLCKVQYTNLDNKMIEKVKFDCDQTRLPFKKHPDQLWRAAVSSERRSVIVLSADLSTIESVTTKEKHGLSVPLREEVGGFVVSQQWLGLQDRSPGTLLVKEDIVDMAIKNIEDKTGHSFVKHRLYLTDESKVCTDGNCPSFFSMVNGYRGALNTDNLGTTKSASAFIKLVNIARETKEKELIKTLKNSKNKNIKLQLVDILAATQTGESHKAVMKVLDFKSEELLDLNERYLWAMSFGSHPLPSVIKDFIKIAESGEIGEKLEQTLLLTIAAMTKNYKKLNLTSDKEIEEDVLRMLLNNLGKCSKSNDDCCLKYIRALKNLGAKESITTLLDYAKTGSKRVSVAAINAVNSFPKSSWSDEVLKVARKIFFQLDKRYDSSARTMSLDILLISGPDDGLLSDLLLTLTNQDPAYEVKQYMMQRLNQLGASDKTFSSKIRELLKSLKLTNYNILSQKGLSTAFTRTFMNHPSANGSLSTVQEIYGGIVKRGLVDVIIDKDQSSQSIFTLGLFANGLSSFLSSEDSSSEEVEAETATAGMDLMVMGVQLRPFVFFNGQGELMGHVWSGTASESVPAFQILSLLQEHLEYIPLQSGYIAELTLQSGISFDLSGQISISIWNRKAESLVKKSAGLYVAGQIKVDSVFIESQLQFNVGTEMNLVLLSDIDFSSNVALCLQLQQPNSVIKHNIQKVERIPESKHHLRKLKKKVIQVSGRTYALNQKNNEMCNVIFN